MKNGYAEDLKLGKSVTATDGYHSEQLESLLESNRRIKCDKMAHKLEIIVGSVHTILCNCSSESSETLLKRPPIFIH